MTNKKAETEVNIQMPISRDFFRRIISDIKKCFDYEDEINDVNYKYNVDGIMSLPNCVDSCIELLTKVLHDEEGDMIGYWIYEENFGETYDDGDVVDESGNNIPLKTIDDLYDYLVDNYINRK